MSGVQSSWCYLQIELSGAFIDELKADEVTASSSGTRIVARSRRYAADWMNVGYVATSLVRTSRIPLTAGWMMPPT